MLTNNLSSKNLLLAFLYSPGLADKPNEPISGRTKLTKMVFLFEKELKSKFFNNVEITIPKFTAHYYGPFSAGLYEDLRFFLSIDFIEEKPSKLPLTEIDIYEEKLLFNEDEEFWGVDDPVAHNNIIRYDYCLTEKGQRYTETKVWKLFSDKQIEALKQFKKNINTASIYSILNYVYSKYPEQTANSPA